MFGLISLILLHSSALADVPQEFLAKHQAREEMIQTSMVRSVWKDFVNGQPTRRDRQTIYRDDLSRRRIQMESEQMTDDGHWVRHEQVPYEWDVLFNGEIAASMTFDPRKNRIGEPLKKSERGEYSTAQIFGEDTILKSQRTPLSFADGIVTRLEAALQNNQPVEVKSEESGLTTLRFPNNEENEFWVFQIDRSRDWIPVMISLVRETNDMDKLVMRTDFEYAKTETGIWYPKKGVHRYFGSRSKDETPLRETRFEVIECRINDPDFDESIFEIVLAPDTAVWDARYDVDYRVGGEKVFTKQLTELAEQALSAAQAKHTEEELLKAPLDRNNGNRMWILLWINVAILALILSWLGYRRWIAR